MRGLASSMTLGGPTVRCLRRGLGSVSATSSGCNAMPAGVDFLTL
jgi:hypothetical protein